VKVFLAWSGPASEQLASFMHEWLQSVIQAIQPFMSSKDIRQGQRWASEVGATLAEVDFALLCLTPTNLNSRWIHFEAGAVSKNIATARVSALLFDVTPSQIEFPLQQFQHTALTRGDLWKLVQDLNKLCSPTLTEAQLQKSFDRNYGDLEAVLVEIRKTLAQEQTGHHEPKRSTEAILSDLLTTQQGLAAKLDAMETSIRTGFQQANSLSSSRQFYKPDISAVFDYVLDGDKTPPFTQGMGTDEFLKAFRSYLKRSSEELKIPARETENDPPELKTRPRADKK
jgi:hypothetical protein